MLKIIHSQWVPEPPAQKKKNTKVKTKKSLLSGFGTASIITEKIDEDVSETHVLSSCLEFVFHFFCFTHAISELFNPCDGPFRKGPILQMPMNHFLGMNS